MTAVSPEDLFIAQAEVEIGVARRACPGCSVPLVIRLPRPSAVVVADASKPESAALRFDLYHLTQTEQDVFDAVYTHFPHAVSTKVIADMVPTSADALRGHTKRMRAKLAKSGWLLITYHNCLRLIEPTRVVDEPPKPSP